MACYIEGNKEGDKKNLLQEREKVCGGPKELETNITVLGGATSKIEMVKLFYSRTYKRRKVLKLI